MHAPPPPAALLRYEVGMLRRRETRRVFDPVVYVGSLGGDRDSVVVPARDRPVLDAGLRTDLVVGLLDDADPGHRTAWLVRPGRPELHDDDLAWLSAARSAFAVHGRELGSFYAVTRYGWLDPVTGQSRAWKRLRI